MGERGPRPKPNQLRAIGPKNPPRKELKIEVVVPKPPAWLSPGAKKIWKYLAAELEKNGLLAMRDRDAFAMLCVDVEVAQAAYKEMFNEKKEMVIREQDKGHQGRDRRSPGYMVYREASASYRKWCDEFGLTPVARLELLGDPSAEGKAIPDNNEDDAFSFRRKAQ